MAIGGFIDRPPEMKNIVNLVIILGMVFVCNLVTATDPTMDDLLAAKKLLSGGDVFQNILHVKSLDDVTISWCSIGITNRMAVARNRNDATLACTVKLYGPNTEEFIDRDCQSRVEKLLIGYGIGKQVYHRTDVGQVEEWISGSPLDAQQLRIPENARLIAQIAASIHKIDPHLLYNTMDVETGATNTVQSVMWKRIYKQIDIIFDNTDTTRIKTLKYSKDEIVEAARRIEQAAIKSKSPIKICHTDLTGGNIIKSHNGEIRLIDFEYSGPMETAFEIANYFCEYMSFDLIADDFPTEAEQQYFLSEYNKQSGVEPLKIDQIDVFVNVSHLYWGLWGLCQVIYSPIDFEFEKYGITRLNWALDRKYKVYGGE